MQWDTATIGIGLLVTILVLALGVVWAFKRRRVPRPIEVTPEQSSVKEAPKGNLSGALAKTRTHWLSGLSRWVGANPAQMGASEWDALEEALLTADVSMATSQKLLGAVREKSQGNGSHGLTEMLREEVGNLFNATETGWQLPDQPRPFVISIVGVNGAGKTTTVGKLAHRFSQSGHRVLLGAVDTFRAAAIEQLRVWSERAGCQFVSGREGADPGATAFDAVSAGVSRGMDLVLLDTAGRLHTKAHLMDELKRVHKVVKKVLPDAPHQVWLVVDGTLGQNSVVQAKQFHEALGVTGIIVTKLDGTAKGGSVLSIAGDLKIPVRFIGVGETAADLMPFEPKAFAEALLTT